MKEYVCTRGIELQATTTWLDKRPGYVLAIRPKGGITMGTPSATKPTALWLTRRQLLNAGLVAGATIAMRPLARPPLLWGGEAGQPKRGGILRVRGSDPPNFDHHFTSTGLTQSTVSFVYSKLVRHKVGADITPGTFIIEPDLAERWEELDDTTYVFHLRHGVKWHHKPPVNGREFVAEDVKFSSLNLSQFVEA
jgi:ABC-type transport system substrate-binding protein